MNLRNTALGLVVMSILLVGTNNAFASGEGWHTDWDKAVAAAKKHDRLILAKFTGSDWCAPCKLMAKELLDTEQFKAWSKDNIELLYLDFPFNTPISEKQKKHNEALRDKYGIQGYPTVMIMDTDGKPLYQKSGFTPGSAPKYLAEFKREIGKYSAWEEGSIERRKRLADLKKAPALSIEKWINSEGITAEDMKGKVVVVKFWATWCDTCVESIPHNNRLVEQYGDKGLLFIGVVHDDSDGNLAKVVKAKGATFPIGVDKGGQADDQGETFVSWRVDGVPDYYVVDRAGNLTHADVKNGKVESIIQQLLAPSDKKKPEKKATDADAKK